MVLYLTGEKLPMMKALEEVSQGFPTVKDEIRNIQIEKILTLKKHRDNDRVSKLLSQLSEKAMTEENLMPYVIEAVENNCTLGEISDALRKVFGEYK